MADTNDWGDAAVATPPKENDWGDAPLAQPAAPKMPDTSGVQKMAQDNLAANDNKATPEGEEPKVPSTPEQNLSTAAGVPINNLLNPNDKTPFPRSVRENLTKSYANGSASNAGDFWQSTLHAISPIAADAKEFLANTGKSESAIFTDALNPSGAPTEMSAEQYRDWYNNRPKQGALAQFGEDTSPLLSAVSLPFSPVFSILGAGARYIEKQSVEPEERAQMPPEEIEKRENVAEAAGQGLAGVALAFSPFLHPPIADNVFPPRRPSETPPVTPEPLTIEGEYRDIDQKLLSPPWDDHPGSEPIKDIVAKKTNIAPSAVPSTAVDQHIADATTAKGPTANDFKAVESVTGGVLPEKTLHIVYNETGVKPDQVFTDAQRNPQVAADVAAGKVPEQYEHLVAPKPELSPEQADKLTVSPDEATHSFMVVDKEGDHVSGGFDSAEEARHYIEDEKFKADERAAIEEEQNQKAQDVFTPKDAETASTPKAPEGMYGDIEAKVAGMSPEMQAARLGSLNKKMEAAIITPKEMAEREALSAIYERPEHLEKTSGAEQAVIPGAEKATAATMAQRGTEAPMRGGAAPLEGGLFDVAGRGQGDLLDIKHKESLPSATEFSDAISKKLGVDVALQDTKYGLHLASIRVAEGERKGGIGSAAMKEITDYADKAGKRITLTPTTDFGASSVARLEKFYKQFGFVKNAGKNKDFSTRETMIRQSVKDASPERVIAPKEKPQNVILPSETGKPTSLKSFLLNNGGKIDETKQLISMKENGKVRESDLGLDRATEIVHQAGYFDHRPSIPELQDKLLETNGGLEHTRLQDADRVAKAKEAAEARKNFDPVNIEKEAHSAGLDTDIIKSETDKQRTSRLTKALQEFYKNQEGSGAADAMRQAIGGVIKTAEKFTGKLTGGFFEKVADGYIKTFQPELMGDKALRVDAYLAKYKASAQEAENAYYRQFATDIKRWDRATRDEQLGYIHDYETGNWNEEENPENAMHKALLDATFSEEKKAIGADAEKGYKENYLPLQFKDPIKAKAFFDSPTMIKKYGADWFTKPRHFDMIEDAVRAGIELKTYNPARMVVSRLLAGDNMIRTMDLLHDMESSGTATRATSFSIDKKVAKTQAAITEIETKYKKAFEKMNNPDQARMGNVPPAVSRLMQTIETRLNDLKGRLDDFTKEKADNKLTPAQMAELKTGFRVIGPDSKAWNIHPQAMPLWKNAMEMKGLYENQGVTGDAYRTYTAGKAIWTQVKLGLSLFHPLHVAMIDLASDIASSAHHLIQGGKLSDLASQESLPNLGLTKETVKGQDHPAIQAWNTPSEARTPEQHQMVERMVEGGFNPIMSARDTVHFRENFDKAINGVGLNNLRLIGTAASLPGLVMKPFFEHWIPGMKAEIYLKRYQAALDRDPSLANDAGRRGEVARQIAKDTDRTYGEMNNNVQFWNKNVRDSFNAAFISGGWKLAQIYNAKGLLQPGKIAYKFAKAGEFSKSDITYNMLHAYAYTGLTLALGGAINKILGNPIGTAKDDVWDIIKNLVAPQTGEKNPDGTPIRLNQPAFAKEAYNAAHEINTKGLIAGSASFLYHQTLIPGIVNTLNNRDFYGRQEISDPTDLHQWMNAGWESVMPISVSQYERSEQKGSDVGKVAGVLGFPTAGTYINQTPFEQKIIAKYDEQNPPKGDAYEAKLKSEMKGAIASKDTTAEADIEKKMKAEGMTEQQISHSKTPFKTPFAEFAWTKLSAEDQKRLIESATPEEKVKFKLKSSN